MIGTWAGIYQSWHLRWEAGAYKTGGCYRRFFGCKFLSTGGAGTLPAGAVPEAGKKQGTTTAIFRFKCLPAGGAGTLPAEAVPEACKEQGATIGIFVMNAHLEEEPVLCLPRLSLKQVKYRGPLWPFVFSWRIALFGTDFLLR